MHQNPVNKNHAAQMLITIIQRTVIKPDEEESGGQIFNLLNKG